MRLFLTAFALMAFFSAATSPADTARDPALPKLYEIPSFKLKDQDGKALDKEALRGNVWVANFIFTSCGDECPLMTSKLKSAQDHLKGTNGISFVSITTDPKTDTPKVLKKYAKLHKVEESNWRFLTGSKKDIVELANKGFKFPAQEKSVAHSEKFAVVDGLGWVRAYYDSSSTDDLKRMEVDMRRLATEK
jgi:protein SCO1/2